MNFKIIVATDKNNGIGINNILPWNFKSDMKFFRDMTKGNGNNAVVMGKNTFLSIGKKLPDRENLVLSTSLEPTEGIHVFKNINYLIAYCKSKYFDSIWIIGGGEIYRQFLDLNLIHIIHLTEIDSVYNCDTFFPNIFNDFFLSHNIHSVIENDVENDVELTFKKYYKIIK